MPKIPGREGRTNGHSPPAEATTERSERLGVNLFDLTGRPAVLWKKLLAGRLDLSAAALADGLGEDDRVVAVTGGLLGAALALDLLRSEDRRVGREPCRVYLRKGSGPWGRLGPSEVLTRVVAGKTFLDPAVFPGATAERLRMPTPRSVRGVALGRPKQWDGG